MPCPSPQGEEKGYEPHSNTVPSWKRFLTAALKQETYRGMQDPGKPGSFSWFQLTLHRVIS